VKKSLVFVITMILAISLSFCFCLPNRYSYADELTPENYGEPGDTTEADIDSSFVTDYAGRFSGFLYGLAILIAVVCVTYLGLKYIVGGAFEKADYKKDVIPMVIGIGIVVFLGTILKIIANAAASI